MFFINMQAASVISCRNNGIYLPLRDRKGILANVVEYVAENMEMSDTSWMFGHPSNRSPAIQTRDAPSLSLVRLVLVMHSTKRKSPAHHERVR